MSLDSFDRAILEQISQHGRMSVTELARRVGLSKTPCQVRLKKLEASGYILGYRAVLNPQRLNLRHIAFVEVKLDSTSETSLSAFNAAVHQIPEVEQCHMIAGQFDYLLKVRTADIDAYRHVLGERISQLPHVQSTSSFVSMEAVKEDIL